MLDCTPVEYKGADQQAEHILLCQSPTHLSTIVIKIQRHYILIQYFEIVLYHTEKQYIATEERFGEKE